MNTAEDIHNVNTNNSGHRNVNSGIQHQESSFVKIKFSSLNISVSDYSHKESLLYQRVMDIKIYDLSI